MHPVRQTIDAALRDAARMTMSGTDSNIVDLSNCAREPIHIPGRIQPHGVLLAFDHAGQLSDFSANASALLSVTLAHLQRLDALRPHIASDEYDLIQDTLQSAAAGDVSTLSIDALVHGQPADLVVHAHNGRIIAEWELRSASADQLTSFALKAHRMIDQLRRQKTVAALLDRSVAHVRSLTGFDRVMAYRFRHDESGDILAESCAPDLFPFLGRRYPASDIPTQARRLYLLNTLRLIGDVNYAAVPILSDHAAQPLDMSFCVLRSVSPIHIEYLQNMGVAASMSVSIVVAGKLWGLIACHHRVARHVPYSIRMACDVLAQVMGASILGLHATEHAAAVQLAGATRSRVMESVLHAEDFVAALTPHQSELTVSLDADALLIGEHGKIFCSDAAIDEATASAMVLSFNPDKLAEPVLRTARNEWPVDVQKAIGPWVGALALPFNLNGNGWIIALRREQVETVRWAGVAEKVYKVGPHGPRLTPPGSMDEWRQTVLDTAEPWSSTTQESARNLLTEMHRTMHARMAELDRARGQLMAMLSHDLRDPLSTIDMATSLLEHGSTQPNIARYLSSASSRMQRLVNHILDMSRIDSGQGLDLLIVNADLADLLRTMVAEANMTHPGVAYEYRGPVELVLPIDGDRLVQLTSNLLSNARYYGERGFPIVVHLASSGDATVLEVRNTGAPIDAVLVDTLFSPLKHQVASKAKNRTGLGLGLFIAQQIALAHGATMGYRFDTSEVVFFVNFPIRRNAG